MLTKQRGKYDCLLACLSMATDREYESLWPVSFCEEIETAKGTYNDNIAIAFSFANLPYKSIYTGMLPKNGIYAFLWKRRAILQVPSLNYEDAQHMVYWDGENIKDPSNLQVYQWIKQMPVPEYVFLFDET